MLKTSLVQVVARSTDVAFVIDEEAPIDVVAKELCEYLAVQAGLWSKGDITLNVGQRMMAREELSQLKTIIETHSGLMVTRFWCSPDSLDSGDLKIEMTPSPKDKPSRARKNLVHNEIELPTLKRQTVSEPQPITKTHTSIERQTSEPQTSETQTRVDSHPKDETETQTTEELPSSVESIIEELKARHNKNGARNRNRTEALFIKSTFRSGESVYHPGDVVVLADVNPGAEIRADGDIVVLGALKGWGHAGASGDDKAVIIAQELIASRIKIGNYEGVAPSSSGRKARAAKAGNQIAYVRSRSIHVGSFVGRFSRYSKGVPYDG
ncbi:MAG: septum site-determining protein MinC [Chloroflexi bacterium]|nr:septum site-determining protein MinC [Chloroflexota bacterium]